MSPIANSIHDLVDLAQYPFGMDVHYARADNFHGSAVYPFEAAFLQRPVAEALLRVHHGLEIYGYGILVFDGYRPWSVTKAFWDAADENQREFLANPDRGSVHNRGCAVDCSLFRLKDGSEVKMPSAFDEMNETAWSAYAGGTKEARAARDLLIRCMHAEKFAVITREWWHFNHPAEKNYPVLDLDFTQVLRAISERDGSISGRP